MDYRSRILAAIDTIYRGCRLADGIDVAHQMAEFQPRAQERVKRELRAMAKAGLVVYDRKASGWRRA